MFINLLAQATDTFCHGGWVDHTTLNPLALVTVLLMGLGMLFMPRRWAFLPIIIIACFIAPAQRIVVAGLDFNLLRVMVLFGWARILMRGEVRGFRWTGLDTAMVLWVISGTIIYTLQQESASALIYKMGVAFDGVGMYFLFRCLVRSWLDVDRLVLSFIVISIPVAIAFLIEHATGHNAFAVMGGVPAITVIRDGKLRCQGAFSHPILAGCFWASLLPLVIARWWAGRKERKWVLIGITTFLIVIYCCASSTPVMAVFFGILGLAMFSYRKSMRWIRWGILLTLIGLHLVMKAPVWNLIARMDIIGGSSGWHRYNLINQAINRFSEWWLLGTKSTTQWDTSGLLRDVTNEYILEGVRGGFLTLVFFLATIIVAFKYVGQLWRRNSNDSYHLWLSWALGVSLFVHCMIYLSVTYFGQTIIVWYSTLAIIASLNQVKKSAVAPIALPKDKSGINPTSKLLGMNFRYQKLH